jgi:hypothetical protein
MNHVLDLAVLEEKRVEGWGGWGVGGGAQFLEARVSSWLGLGKVT